MEFPLIKILIGLVTLLALLTSFLATWYSIRVNRLRKERNEMESKFNITLLKSQLEITEATFKVIAQEMHDNLGQTLSVIKLQLKTVDLNYLEPAASKLEHIKSLVSTLSDDMDSLAKSIRTDKGLPIGQLLENEIEHFKRTGLFEIEWYSSGEVSKLGPDTDVILFRMAQEILNNIIKHANASKIRVLLQHLASGIRLEIKDNGTGFNVQNERGKGMGLDNLFERAKLIGASLKIESAAGNGTDVIIDIPINTEKE